MDYSQLSNDDLLALKAGDYSKLSNEALLALKSQASSMPRSVVEKKPDYNTAAETLGSYADALGFNIPSKIAAAISTPFEKYQDYKINKKMKEDFGDKAVLLPERSFSETFGDIVDEQKARKKAYSEDNPGLSLATDVAGLITPGGGFSRSYKAAEKGVQYAGKGITKAAPFISKLLSSSKTANRVADLAKIATRGGAANTIYQTINPDDEQSISESFAYGAAGDVLGTGVMKAPGFIGKLLKSGAESAKNMTVATAKSLPVVGDMIKNMSAQKAQKVLSEFGNQIDELASKYGADDAMSAGSGVREKIGKIYDDIGSEYGKIRESLVPKYGDESISAENLRKTILSKLDDAGLLDDIGNLDSTSPILNGPEESSYKALFKMVDALKQNPSVKQVDRWIKNFATLANFKGANRTPINKLYGELYGSAKESLLDGLQSKLEEAGKNTPEAKKIIKQIGNLAKISDDASVKASDPLAGENFKKAMSDTASSVQGKIGNLSSSLDGIEAKAAQDAQMTIDEFRAARTKYSKNKNILDKLSKVTRKDATDIVRGSKSNFKPEFINTAIDTNPAFSDPIRQAIMGDIYEKATDPKKLNKILDHYSEGTLKKVFGSDYELLKKAAGRMEKDPSYLKTLLNKIKVPESAKTAGELMLKTPALLLSK